MSQMTPLQIFICGITLFLLAGGAVGLMNKIFSKQNIILTATTVHPI